MKTPSASVILESIARREFMEIVAIHPATRGNRMLLRRDVGRRGDQWDSAIYSLNSNLSNDDVACIVVKAEQSKLSQLQCVRVE